MKKCKFCAEEIKDKAIKCKHCGSNLSITIETKKKIKGKLKIRKTAIILAILLGFGGIHKIYTNRPGQFIFYAFFAFTGISIVLGFFDAYRYYKMSKEEFDEKYNYVEEINKGKHFLSNKYYNKFDKKN